MSYIQDMRIDLYKLPVGTVQIGEHDKRFKVYKKDVCFQERYIGGYKNVVSAKGLLVIHYLCGFTKHANNPYNT